VSSRVNDGLWAWKQPENNNRMIAFQDAGPQRSNGPVELAYFGCSAFRITSPAGLTVLIDPWRNPPWGTWDWFLFDFPALKVDVAISTHAHFDHDGLHCVSANTLLDRLVGTYEFADVKITGIADKHVSDSSHNVYDWAEMTRRLTDMITTPPDNCRSFDNSMILVEVAGLKILHWGDNRPNPPDAVWDRIGKVDIALLPIDGSQHVLSFAQIETIIDRLGARIVVPHHYYAWDVMTRGSTLLPADEWVKRHDDARWLSEGTVALSLGDVKAHKRTVIYFGGNVAFAKPNTKTETVGA
jgi:L-ascorbate metabolism protein UlaG (beta-lactamase superfamily)